MEKKRYLRHWKTILGLALCGVLFYRIPFGPTVQAVKEIPLGLIFLVWMVSGIANLISAYKLQVLLKPQGSLGLLAVLRAYYIGIFFNNFLPTEVGGDVFKVGELKRRGLKLKDAAAAVIVERFTGALILLFLALALSLPGIAAFERFKVAFLDNSFLSPLFFGMAVCLVGCLIWKASIRSFLEKRSNHLFWGRLYKLLQALYIYKDRKKSLLLALAVSVVFHLLGVVNLAVLASAQDRYISFFTLLTVIVAVRLVSMLPISLGSLGVREGMLVFCLTKVGLDAPSALAWGMVLRAGTYVHSGIGAIIYAARR